MPRPHIQVREKAFKDFTNTATRMNLNLVDMFEACLIAFDSADKTTKQAAIEKQARQRPARKRASIPA